MTTSPAASTPCTWKTDLAMSNPIVVIVCMESSSEPWEPFQRPHRWHSRAGGGAVHSINSGSRRSTNCTARRHLEVSAVEQLWQEDVRQHERLDEVNAELLRTSLQINLTGC